MTGATDAKKGLAFRLAEMSPSVRTRTICLLAVPLVCASAVRGPVGVHVALYVSGIYATVWLFFRPRGFVLEPDGMRLAWPLRMKVIPYRQIKDVRLLSSAEYPRGIRVGAGGLGGTFGLVIGGQQSVVLYASRRTGLVQVTREHRLPMCITPADPQAFVDAFIHRLPGSARSRDANFGSTRVLRRASFSWSRDSSRDRDGVGLLSRVIREGRGAASVAISIRGGEPGSFLSRRPRRGQVDIGRAPVRRANGPGDAAGSPGRLLEPIAIQRRTWVSVESHDRTRRFIHGGCRRRAFRASTAAPPDHVHPRQTGRRFVPRSGARGSRADRAGNRPGAFVERLVDGRGRLRRTHARRPSAGQGPCRVALDRGKGGGFTWSPGRGHACRARDMGHAGVVSNGPGGRGREGRLQRGWRRRRSLLLERDRAGMEPSRLCRRGDARGARGEGGLRPRAARRAHVAEGSLARARRRARSRVGPSDRDETIGGTKMFRDLALGLATRKIASLRYDKRTFVDPRGVVTEKEEVLDGALEAIEKLRATAGIDPSRIVVIGRTREARSLRALRSSTVVSPGSPFWQVRCGPSEPRPSPRSNTSAR